MANTLIQSLCLCFVGKWLCTGPQCSPSNTLLARNGVENDEGRVVSLFTWNLLAPGYVKSKRPPPSWLDDPLFDKDWATYTDWNYRQTKINQFLSQSQADILCLQEVELSLIPELEMQWDELGYESHVQDTKGHPVANVILVSKDLQLEVVFQESRSRAFILVLQPPDSSSGKGVRNDPLFLVNVHLQASGRPGFVGNAQTRYSQVQSLVKRVNLAWGRIQEQQGCSPLDREDGNCSWDLQPYLVLMGDFNLSPAEPLYRLLVDGIWPDDVESRKYLPTKVSELTASSLPLLPLQDARQSLQEITSVTYAPTRQVVDYILLSANVEVVERQEYLNARLAELTQSGSQHVFWPNKHHPSDHIPIGAKIRLWSQG